MKLILGFHKITPRVGAEVNLHARVCVCACMCMFTGGRARQISVCRFLVFSTFSKFSFFYFPKVSFFFLGGFFILFSFSFSLFFLFIIFYFFCKFRCFGSSVVLLWPPSSESRKTASNGVFPSSGRLSKISKHFHVFKLEKQEKNNDFL